jgi:hypothetical protein
LANSDIPRIILEPNVENELWCNGIDGGVVDPPLDSEGKRGKPKVWSGGKEDVRDNAI